MWCELVVLLVSGTGYGGGILVVEMEGGGAVGELRMEGREMLPQPEEWKNAPECPKWGPMDTFMEEGVDKERVGWLLFLCQCQDDVK